MLWLTPAPNTAVRDKFNQSTSVITLQEQAKPGYNTYTPTSSEIFYQQNIPEHVMCGIQQIYRSSSRH